MKLSSFFILAFLALACSSEEPAIITDDWEDPLKDLPDKGPIRFDTPEIGQRSSYVLFNAHQDMATMNITVSYDPDTLVLAITGKESDKWVIREFMTKGSTNDALADEVIIRHLSLDSDSAYFFKPQNAFHVSWVFIGDRMSIPLKPVSDPAELNPDCMPFFGYDTNVWTQYTVNYTSHGQTFDHLNNYYDYREMAGDGLGLMYAYGPAYGIVRWTWVSAWVQYSAQGWDLIPNKN